MKSKDKYIKNAENSMKKYKDKISKIESELKKYESKGKMNLLSESNKLKEKYKEAEKMVKSLKTSTADNFEDLKDEAVSLFNDLKDGYSQLSNLITKDKIMHTKEDIVEYGREKVSKIEDYSKKNPVKIAAISLAVGFVIGQLTRRSK